jgi:broad specificity phosphatase PhoE
MMFPEKLLRQTTLKQGITAGRCAHLSLLLFDVNNHLSGLQSILGLTGIEHSGRLFAMILVFMCRFYLIRHGHTEALPGDPPLTDKGVRQAQLVGRWLQQQPVDLVMASPLARARQTADVVAGMLNLPVTIESKLRERMNWGDLPGQSVATFTQQWRHASEDRYYCPDSGDSSIATAERMKAALRAVYNTPHLQQIAIITHQDTIIDLLRSLFGDDEILPLKDNLLEDGIPHCSITELDFKQGIYRLTRFASTSHLQPLRQHTTPQQHSALNLTAVDEYQQYVEI